MEHQSLLMELQSLPMEHLRRHMGLQSLHMRPLFPPTKPQNPHTEHQSLLMEPQSLLIAAQQQCQRQCMHLHLPNTRAHPMEPPQPQWCKLPTSGTVLGPCSKNFPDSEFVGIRERQTSRPLLTLTMERMYLAQQGKEGLMNATVCLLHRCLYIPLFQSSPFSSNHFVPTPI